MSLKHWHPAPKGFALFFLNVTLQSMARKTTSCWPQTFRCWTSSSQRVPARAPLPPTFWELDVQHRNFSRRCWTSSSQRVRPPPPPNPLGAGRPAPKFSPTASGGPIFQCWTSSSQRVSPLQPFGSWTSSTEIFAHRWRSGKISVLDVQLPKRWRGEHHHQQQQPEPEPQQQYQQQSQFSTTTTAPTITTITTTTIERGQQNQPSVLITDFCCLVGGGGSPQPSFFSHNCCHFLVASVVLKVFVELLFLLFLLWM